MSDTAISPRRAKRILDALNRGPATSTGIAAALGIHWDTAQRYARWLNADERIHIADWVIELSKAGQHRHVQLWAAGPGTDALRPRQDAADATTLAGRRRAAVRDAHALARDLKHLRAENPLQALVFATLHANRHSQE